MNVSDPVPIVRAAKLSEADYAAWKEVHCRVRERHRQMAGSHRHRHAMLAWAYVRGIPYRRVENCHRVQALPGGGVYEHGLPCVLDCIIEMVVALSGKRFTQLFAEGLRLRNSSHSDVARFIPFALPSGLDLSRHAIERWLKDPAGAVPPPARQAKRRWTEDEIAAARGRWRAPTRPASSRRAEPRHRVPIVLREGVRVDFAVDGLMTATLDNVSHRQFIGRIVPRQVASGLITEAEGAAALAAAEIAPGDVVAPAPAADGLYGWYSEQQAKRVGTILYELLDPAEGQAVSVEVTEVTTGPTTRSWPDLVCVGRVGRCLRMNSFTSRNIHTHAMSIPYVDRLEPPMDEATAFAAAGLFPTAALPICPACSRPVNGTPPDEKPHPEAIVEHHDCLSPARGARWTLPPVPADDKAGA